MRNQLGKRRLIWWTGNSQLKESSLPVGENGAGAPEFTLDSGFSLKSGANWACTPCPAIPETSKRTKTIHLRITTFSAQGLPWRFLVHLNNKDTDHGGANHCAIRN